MTEIVTILQHSQRRQVARRHLQSALDWTLAAAICAYVFFGYWAVAG
jgi:hypothetical protein